MVLCNSVGTGDRPYTGEYCAFFYHVMPDMPKYEPGNRIAQMKIGFTVPIEFVEVEDLDETDRSDGGFGSTGLK
jgi:dUTP pyrophosphatase